MAHRRPDGVAARLTHVAGRHQRACRRARERFRPGRLVVAQLRAQAQVHDLAINPVMYAELSPAFESFEALDGVLADMQVAVEEIPRPTLFLAGRAFVKYRRHGGTERNVLPDFFIGAHAAVLGCGILTRDARRYAQHFKTVPLITPEP